MAIGILGLQGAVQDHLPHLRRCGVEPLIVRDPIELAAVERLILPGGESTVMIKFLGEFGMLPVLKERIAAGLPVWGICAGAILLAGMIDGAPGPVGALPLHVRRNAYGRQIASRRHGIEIPLFDLESYPAIFIRAPRIEDSAATVTVHALLYGDPIFVQYRRIMATTFHPELNGDDRFYEYFLLL
jgi:5'-phosphate synthase pdxT subunit